MNPDHIDTSFAVVIQSLPPSGEPPVRRRRGPKGTFNRLDVSAAGLAALLNGERISDDTFYAAVAVLADRFPNRLHKLAVFPTRTIPAWRDCSTIASLVASIAGTTFWTRDITVIPIHVPGHWLVAFAYRKHRRIELFDPAADAHAWQVQGEVRAVTSPPPYAKNLKAVATLLNALLKDPLCAPADIGTDDGEQWTCLPLVVRALRKPAPAADLVLQQQPLDETDGKQCAVWCIAAVVAVLRSWRMTGLQAEDIPHLRQYIYTLLSAVPPM